MNKTQKESIQEKIAKLQEELKQIEATELNTEWYEYKKGWEISTKQQFNNKTYSKIKQLVKEENIATYELLQELRNKGLTFLKEFWVFVPNPDKISLNNKYEARFDAYSDWAGLDCSRNLDFHSSGLGVFVVRKKEIK